ncbi:MAG: Glycosyl transferases group 1 [Parcubacteria group bacterium GW2011_GWB1_44_7]|nr:MAG: Glycosyl transferases group 1 [Parcubacteria group bacterium GW2011_GWB1_44_7]
MKNRLQKIESVNSVRNPNRNKDRKTVLGIIIDTDFAVPPKTGVTYRLHFLSKKLAERGLETKIFLCNRNIKTDADIANFPNTPGIEFHIIPEEAFYTLPVMRDIIRSSGVTILQTEDAVSLLRYHPIAKELALPMILEMHDVEATLKEGLGFEKEDIKMTEKISRLATKLSCVTICMTPTDREELINKIGAEKDKLRLIPNPIDLKEFKYSGPNEQAHTAIFVGNMFYWPNQNAANFIVDKLHQELKRRDARVHLTLVGMVPDDIKNKCSGNTSVTVTGPTDNLNKILKTATIALCPVKEGSGMKVKILNYCAAGLPIVTTTIGASGYEHVSSLVIEDDLNRYAEIIVDLLRDRDKLVDLGKKNRDFVERFYDIDKLSDFLIEIYSDTGRVKTPPSDRNLDGARIEIPLPLWLKEDRVRKITNKKYYVIKNGLVTHSQTLP